MSDTDNTNTAAADPAADAAAEQAAAEPAPAARPARTRAKASDAEAGFYATLVRGENYAIRHEGKVYRFKGGKRVGPVPESLKTRLNKTAVDYVTVTDGDNSSVSEPRRKFEFEAA